MKKVVIALLLIIPIIGVNTVNNKNYELETVTNTYTKEEIDSKLEEIRTSINNNKTSIEENKNILTAIQNKLNDYALKTALNKANSNIDSLNTIVTNNTNKIKTIENGKTLIAKSITNKGIATSSTASFETMANNIDSLGVSKVATGTFKPPTNDDGTISISIGFKPDFVFIYSQIYKRTTVEARLYTAYIANISKLNGFTALWQDSGVIGKNTSSYVTAVTDTGFNLSSLAGAGNGEYNVNADASWTYIAVKF